jgi:hypothetical protein
VRTDGLGEVAATQRAQEIPRRQRERVGRELVDPMRDRAGRALDDTIVMLMRPHRHP